MVAITSNKKKLENIKRWIRAYAETLLSRKESEKVIRHIAEMHCGRSDEQLLERVYAEHLDSASTFYGTQDQVIEMIKNALISPEILDQLAYFLVYAKPGDRAEFFQDYDHTIGQVMYNTGAAKEASTLVVVIEQTSSDLSTGLQLITAYCEEG